MSKRARRGAQLLLLFTAACLPKPNGEFVQFTCAAHIATGRAARFDATATVTASAALRFDFGDGTSASAFADRVVSHAFADAGAYTVTLTAAPGARASHAIIVEDAPVAPQCQTPAGCDAGLQCDRGTCIFPVSCLLGAHCGPFTSCVHGLCVPDRSSGCDADQSCPIDQCCRGDLCRTGCGLDDFEPGLPEPSACGGGHLVVFQQHPGEPLQLFDSNGVALSQIGVPDALAKMWRVSSLSSDASQIGLSSTIDATIGILDVASSHLREIAVPGATMPTNVWLGPRDVAAVDAADLLPLVFLADGGSTQGSLTGARILAISGDGTRVLTASGTLDPSGGSPITLPAGSVAIALSGALGCAGSHVPVASAGASGLANLDDGGVIAIDAGANCTSTFASVSQDGTQLAIACTGAASSSITIVRAGRATRHVDLQSPIVAIALATDASFVAYLLHTTGNTVSEAWLQPLPDAPLPPPVKLYAVLGTDAVLTAR